MKPLKITQINWDKLRSFYLLAQHSSLSEAALHLKMNQSALSRSLTDLERKLGLKLIERRPRGIVLLREGQDLLNVISPFFQDLIHYEEHRRSQSTTLQGQLRLSLSPHLPVSCLIQETPHFLKQYPDLDFSLIYPQGFKEASVNQADCVIQAYEVGQKEDWVQQPLVTLRYGLYVSQSYLNQHKPLEKIEDIDQHTRILLKTASTPAWGWPQAVPYQSETAKSHTFSTAHDVLWATQQGLGIAALPRRQAVQHPDVVALSFYLEEPKVELYYSYPKSYQSFKRVTLYGQFLTESLKEETFIKTMLSRSSSDIGGINRRLASVS